MSTKAPIYLKRGSRRGKKEKLRDVLSGDMISPPLGDFRHTIHIGSGEDELFGDLSFLQGKFHLLPGHQASTLPQFQRTASVCVPPPPSCDSSPLLKNAVSLPVIGTVQALTLPSPTPEQVPPPKPPRLHLDDKPVSTPCVPPEPYMSHGSSMLSLHLDLGPSILDDVLQIMDKHSEAGLSCPCVQASRQEIVT